MTYDGHPSPMSLVSVILPYRNAASTLGAAIESVLASTHRAV